MKLVLDICSHEDESLSKLPKLIPLLSQSQALHRTPPPQVTSTRSPTCRPTPTAR